MCNSILLNIFVKLPDVLRSQRHYQYKSLQWKLFPVANEKFERTKKTSFVTLQLHLALRRENQPTLRFFQALLRRTCSAACCVLTARAPCCWTPTAPPSRRPPARPGAWRSFPATRVQTSHSLLLLHRLHLGCASYAFMVVWHKLLWDVAVGGGMGRRICS